MRNSISKRTDFNLYLYALLLILLLACSEGDGSQSYTDGDEELNPDGDGDGELDDDSKTGDVAPDGDNDWTLEEDLDPARHMLEAFDLPYTPPDGGDADMALLDIYYLPDGQAKRLIVFVHGGSWVGGDKNKLQEAPTLAPWFVKRGFVMAVPNFRLASRVAEGNEVSYAEQSTDLAFALAWLKDHASAYGVTKAGVVLMGYSSGAHLVALLAADDRYLQSAGLTRDHLAAVMSFDVHAYDVPYALQLMQGSELEQNVPLIEHLFGKTEAEQLEGSPVSFIEFAAMPPSLLISADPSAEVGSKGFISYQGTRHYSEALQASGHPMTFSHFDKETHASLVLDFGTAGDVPTQVTADFLDEYSL